MIKFILDTLRGAVIGVANVIPGVSGGTMMVSMGIYDTIIECINTLFKKFKKNIITLIPIVLGMLLGIVGFAYVIEFLFERFPLPTALLFVGLIFGGIPMIFKRVKGKIDPICVILFVLFFGLVVGLQILNTFNHVDRTLTLSVGGIVIAFVLGLIGSATMIIPGVSGSMVMLILGYYHSIMNLIKGIVDALLAGDFMTVLKDAGVLIPFALGILVGIFGVAKLISYLIEKHEAKTFSAILGLIVASPVPVFMESGITGISPLMVIVGVVTFALGCFGAYKLGEK